MYQIVGCLIARRNAPAHSQSVLYLAASPLVEFRLRSHDVHPRILTLPLGKPNRHK